MKLIEIYSIGDKRNSTTCFEIDKNDKMYPKIYEMDFKSLILKPKLRDTNIMNYYFFDDAIVNECSEGEEREEEISISFYSRFDESEIEIVWNSKLDEGDPLITLYWNIWYCYASENWYKSKLTLIKNEVMPDLINKLLAI